MVDLSIVMLNFQRVPFEKAGDLIIQKMGYFIGYLDEFSYQLDLIHGERGMPGISPFWPSGENDDEHAIFWIPCLQTKSQKWIKMEHPILNQLNQLCCYNQH